MNLTITTTTTTTHPNEVTTIFLIIIAIGVFVYFLRFKPKTLRSPTVNFTFYPFVSVTNPNYNAFTHYDSSLQIAYSNSPAVFIFIPARKIDDDHTQHISAKFAIQSFLITASQLVTTVDTVENSGVPEFGMGGGGGDGEW
ncbi:hypothetical protein Hanom_Chr06g00512591 [Helianthus anomalus]